MVVKIMPLFDNRKLEKLKQTYHNNEDWQILRSSNFSENYSGFDKQIFERKIVNIFLPISLIICFGCSKEPSQWDGSFEYQQHMFWLRNKKIKFWYTLLTKGLSKLNNVEYGYTKS